MTISAACATTVRFSPSRYTGKERDSESGNDYFGARYYASTMGRFMSPDVSGEPMTLPYSNIENPQSLNLYAYVKVKS
jgi:RHS repeat-associated protein